MTRTLITVFISSADADSVFVDRLKADVPQRGRWFSRTWHILCLLEQEEVRYA